MREIKYPHFLKCIQFTDDIFWKNIFEELSFGVPPYNTFIRKNYIISNVKNKEFNYKITDDDEPINIYNNLYDILYNKFGLVSDIQIKEDELNVETHNKKRTLKYSIIEEFCTRKRKEHNLSIQNTKRLINYINLSLVIRNISPDDITYNNEGYISSIEGIGFNDNLFKLKDVMINSNYINNDVINESDIMYNNWLKYINNLIK